MHTSTDDPLHCCRIGPQLLLAGAAHGPLAGLTFVAKDMLDVAGYATGAGNPTWLDESSPATTSARVVEQLVSAGATCVGKSITDEFAFSLAGVNAHYGAPVNSAAAGCTCGGSSSGSAAAVAGDLVPFALGTDTGGSIRVPASYCGLVGIRPTHGAVSLDGVVPLAPSFDTLGWFAKDAAMAGRVGDVLLPADSAPAPERLALVTAAQSVVSGPIRDATASAAADLARRTGLPLTTIELPEPDLALWLATFRALQTSEAHAARGAWIAAHPGAVTPDIKARFDSGAAVTPTAFQAAAATRKALSSALLELMSDPPTALVLPSAAGTATPLDAHGAELEGIRTATLRLTCVAGLCGAPGVSLPLMSLDGLPLGLCLVGVPGTDQALLKLAAS